MIYINLVFLILFLPLIEMQRRILYTKLKDFRQSEYLRYSASARAGGSGMVLNDNKTGVKTLCSDSCAEIANSHYKISNTLLHLKAIATSYGGFISFMLCLNIIYFSLEKWGII